MPQEQNDLCTWDINTFDQIAAKRFQQQWLDWAIEASPKQLGESYMPFANLKIGRN